MDGALPACSAQLLESDYLRGTNTHRGPQREGVHVCVSERRVGDCAQGATEATYKCAWVEVKCK